MARPLRARPGRVHGLAARPRRPPAAGRDERRLNCLTRGACSDVGSRSRVAAAAAPPHPLRRRSPAPPAEPVAPPPTAAAARPEATGGAATRGRREPPRRRRRCHGARQGLQDAWASGRTARPTRLRADGRSGARRVSSRSVPDARAAGAHPGLLAPPLRRRGHAARGAAAPPGRLHGLDRLRDRAHLRPRRAGLAQAGDRVGALPAAARREGTEGAPPPAFARPRASSNICDGRFSGRSSSRSRASSRSCRCSTRRSGSPRRGARTRS